MIKYLGILPILLLSLMFTSSIDYVPYIGATNNVNLGNNNLTTSNIFIGNLNDYIYSKTISLSYLNITPLTFGQSYNSNPFPLIIDSSLVVMRPDDNPTIALSKSDGDLRLLISYHGQTPEFDYGVKDTVFSIINNTYEMNDSNFNFIGNIFATNRIGIGNIKPRASLDVKGQILSTDALRIEGYSSLPSGTGLELGFFNNVGYVTAYNRNTSSYLPLYLRGSSVSIKGSPKIGSTNAQANKGLCWRADNSIGYCNTALDSTGSCNCLPIN